MNHFTRFILRSVALITFFLVLSACNSSSGIIFEDFRDRVRNAAGPDARACGELGIGQSEIATDSCLAEAFTNSTAAWSIVRRQGADSSSASGTVVRNRAVTFYSFDGDPNGGGAEDNGQISTRECIEPSLSGIIGDPFTAQPFQCESFAATSSGSGNGQSAPDSPTQVASTPPFVGPMWAWTGYQEMIDGAIEPISNNLAGYTLRFVENDPVRGEGDVTGNVLCNDFSGDWNTGALSNLSALQIADLVATEIACENEPLTESAVFYLQHLATATNYSMQGERLFIATSTGGTMFFTSMLP